MTNARQKLLLGLLLLIIALPSAAAIGVGDAWYTVARSIDTIFPDYRPPVAFLVDAILTFLIVFMTAFEVARKGNKIPKAAAIGVAFMVWLPMVLWMRANNVLLFQNIFVIGIGYLFLLATMYIAFNNALETVSGKNNWYLKGFAILGAMLFTSSIFAAMFLEAQVPPTGFWRGFQTFGIESGDFAKNAIVPWLLFGTLVSVGGRVSPGHGSSGFGGRSRGYGGGSGLAAASGRALTGFVKKLPGAMQHVRKRSAYQKELYGWIDHVKELSQQKDEAPELDKLRAYIEQIDAHLQQVRGSVEQYADWMMRNGRKLPDNYQASLQAQAAKWKDWFTTFVAAINHHNKAARQSAPKIDFSEELSVQDDYSLLHRFVTQAQSEYNALTAAQDRFLNIYRDNEEAAKGVLNYAEFNTLRTGIHDMSQELQKVVNQVGGLEPEMKNLVAQQAQNAAEIKRLAGPLVEGDQEFTKQFAKSLLQVGGHMEEGIKGVSLSELQSAQKSLAEARGMLEAELTRVNAHLQSIAKLEQLKEKQIRFDEMISRLELQEMQLLKAIFERSAAQGEALDALTSQVEAAAKGDEAAWDKARTVGGAEQKRFDDPEAERLRERDVLEKTKAPQDLLPRGVILGPDGMPAGGRL